MSPEEFERLKAEEKAHLRQMRALKQKHRDTQRMASTANALNAMRNPALEDETDAMTERLFRDAAHAEARLDLATEGTAPDAAAEEADREALSKAEAEALVRQMKAAMGGGGDAPSPNAPQTERPAAAPSGAKTIGRTPPAPDDPPPAADSGAKTIGRRRS